MVRGKIILQVSLPSINPVFLCDSMLTCKGKINGESAKTNKS